VRATPRCSVHPHGLRRSHDKRRSRDRDGHPRSEITPLRAVEQENQGKDTAAEARETFARIVIVNALPGLTVKGEEFTKVCWAAVAWNSSDGP
jgi:hypothetical protein